MDNELKYTEEAEINRYLFYSDINEINFFVEDKNKEYEYETIFKRLFKGEYKIASIITANGKTGVKKAFLEFGEKSEDDTTQFNFYIVDGDFDLYIHKEEMVINDHFIYLKYYNIEDYFIDEKAVLNFAKGKMHLLDIRVREVINYDYWKRTIIEQGKKLFFTYCAVQKYFPHIVNVSRNEYLFINDKTGFEKEGGYQFYYDYISKIDTCIDVHIDEIRKTYEEYNDEDYFGLICGKFLLVSLFVYLRSKTKCKFTKDELRWSLLCNFNISKLNYIKERINRICLKS